MKRLEAIFQRELLSYFKSATGWVLIAIFFGLSSFYFSINLLARGFFMAGEMQFMQSLFVMFIPILTMKIFTEERRNGTEVLLYTSPASVWEIVMGKYLAACTMFLLMTSSIWLHMLIGYLMGGRIHPADWSTFIALYLTAMAYIAIGTFFSAIAENQVVAAVVSVVVFFLFILMDTFAQMVGSFITTFLGAIDFANVIKSQGAIDAGAAVEKAISWLTPSNRVATYTEGVFSILPFIFLLSYAFLFLFFTTRAIEKRRWTQK
ncbi:MAG: ABC transporter permease subunit [Clostridiaceae bacterium]|nr:ABC transporter permease subunit [Clostridiaceae bacterium]